MHVHEPPRRARGHARPLFLTRRIQKNPFPPILHLLPTPTPWLWLWLWLWLLRVCLRDHYASVLSVMTTTRINWNLRDAHGRVYMEVYNETTRRYDQVFVTDAVARAHQHAATGRPPTVPEPSQRAAAGGAPVTPASLLSASASASSAQLYLPPRHGRRITDMGYMPTPSSADAWPANAQATPTGVGPHESRLAPAVAAGGLQSSVPRSHSLIQQQLEEDNRRKLTSVSRQREISMQRMPSGDGNTRVRYGSASSNQSQNPADLTGGHDDGISGVSPVIATPSCAS